MLEPGVPARVIVSKEPLRREERIALQSDLVDRGIALSMLEVIPPAGRFFQLLRAVDGDGRLLGVTSLMSARPFVSIKQLLGEGNHVGWDTTIYYAERANRPRVAAALLEAMARRSMYYAMYFGRIDDDVRAALPFVRHRLLETDYRLGRIDCSGYQTKDDFLGGHKRLRRHLRDHAKSGGTVHVHEGPVEPELGRRFSDLVLATYRHHGGAGRWQFKDYAFQACGSFFATCDDAVHIYTQTSGRITGLQSFVRHRDVLELSEGGFERSRDNHHAYEAIIAESVGFAVSRGLQAIGYGGIWNAAKDRYTDPTGRGKVYLLQLYRNRLTYRLAGDRISRWAFRTYFGGRFAGASGEATVVSRQPSP
ncbi:MAG: hypothetical protein HKN93_04400 [Acidimicrobiia bacterium]|nr:hypothetical protein [Acidimicrobiia bacterium]